MTSTGGAPPGRPLFRLTEMLFKAGPTPGQPGVSIDPSPVTVFVGSNNSGKSLALMNIWEWVSNSPGAQWRGGSVIQSLDANWPADQSELDGFLSDRTLSRIDDSGTIVPEQNGTILLRAFNIKKHDQSRPANSQEGGDLGLQPFGSPFVSFSDYCKSRVLLPYTIRLDGGSRFDLVEPQPQTVYTRPPGNHLTTIFRDRAIYERVDAEVYAAFKQHPVINATDPQWLRVSLSESPPPSACDHPTFSPEEVAYQQGARPIGNFGDGVRVYTGLICAIQSLPHALILIDEPEAFLHPSLARRLGAFLARTAQDRNRTLVAATHSAAFLMGCISEVPETNIVRLTYNRPVATARPLSAQQVAQLVKDPLLRSADTLQALFATSAIVCEADADRAFYEEINRRLLQEQPPSGAPDAMVLNAQNWQTLPRLASPLRRLGIPAAMVMDLDTVLDDQPWREHIDLVTSDSSERNVLSAERDEARNILKKPGKAGTGADAPWKCKRFGLNAISDHAERQRVQTILDHFAAYGIFIVPVGQLENWLAQLGVQGKKTWVTEMLTRLGVQGSSVYVLPQTGDIWDFIRQVAHWLADPNRLGLN